MRKQSLITLLTVLLMGVQAIVAQKLPGKFAPVDGSTMVLIGQDLGSIEGYTNSGKFPTPAGVTLYTDLFELYGLNERVSTTAGDTGMQPAMDQYPNSALAIGLWMTESGKNAKGNQHPNGLTDLVNGAFDAQLDQLEAFFKRNAPRPIYLRIGYEFDGPWNNYDPTKYKNAYKYIVDYMRARNVDNVAYVWQSATWGATQPNIIEDYYPGPEYVDYVGLSFFFFAEDYNANNFEYILEFSRDEKLPVMVAELSAQYYDTEEGNFHPFNTLDQPEFLGGEGIWNRFFRDQLIPFLEENDDIIRIISYINADWQSQPHWEWPTAGAGFWGDTRLEVDPFLTQKWNEYINNGNFLHGGPNLLSDLGIQSNGNPNTPTCNDGIKNGNETGIDCGGSCAPCAATPTCNDGIKNGNETGIDCGGSCAPCNNGGNGGGNSTVENVSLLPPNNQILLTIGQDLKTVADYENSGKFPTMGGVTQYVAFYSLQEQDPLYGALGEAPNGTPTDIDVNWGAGPLSAYKGIVGFPESSLSIGMSLAEGNEFTTWCAGCLAGLGNGDWDENIKRFARFAKNHSNTAIYLRLGFEFDGNWNRYKPEEFKSAWQRFVTVMRQEGVTNVAYVWQASSSPVDDILDGNSEDIRAYWPGKEYVDWLGFSWFLQPNRQFKHQDGTRNVLTQKQLADEVLAIAKEEDRPVKICESSPQGFDISELTQCNIVGLLDGAPKTGCQNKSPEQLWNEWFVPFFNYIYEHQDQIRGVDYINVNWDEDTDKFGAGSNYAEGYWGDARVQANDFIANKWLEEISKPIWLHGSPTLNETLINGTGSTPNTPTCTDGIKNGDETGIDCGGSCAPCTVAPTCNDGIKNGDETGIDCGGSCEPCIVASTCTDGIKNGNETGIDCGGSCAPCDNGGNGGGNGTVGNVALLPPNGQILLTIGQDLKTVADYENSGKFPTMGGVTQYVAFYSLQEQDPLYGALGEAPDGTPTDIDVNWGAGPLSAYKGIVGFPESSLSIGMSLAEGNEFTTWCAGCLAGLGNGDWDENIKRFARFAKNHSDTAIYLRLGFEFDGNWNRYKPEEFKSAWQRFVTVMRQEGVTNVAYVWQASSSPVDDILDGNSEDIRAYWPGKEYVDWLGFSWFLQPNRQFKHQDGTRNVLTQKQLADEVLAIAKEEDRPVKICESSPQGFDISELTQCNIVGLLDGDPKTGCQNKSPEQLWNEWFVPFFNYIYEHQDQIRGVDYINVNWDEDTDKFGAGSNYAEGYWGDARVQANDFIANKWLEEISKPIWLHGGPTLNPSLLSGNVLNLEEVVAQSFDISIYPNPSNGLVTIQGKDITSVEVYDISGRTIKNIYTQTDAKTSVSLDMTSVQSGVYLVTVRGLNKQNVTKRLMIE